MRVEWRVYTFPPSSVLATNSKSETKFFEGSSKRKMEIEEVKKK